MAKPAVLLVGEDKQVGGGTLAKLFEAEGLRVAFAEWSNARTCLDEDSFDAVVLVFDAAPTEKQLRQSIGAYEDVYVVVAASGSRSAIDALHAGADDFLDMPGNAADVAPVVAKIQAARAAVDPPGTSPRRGNLLGGSAAMLQVLDLVKRIADGNATVLIRGESGTGKELVARALHTEGPRRTRPFVKVHCAGIPEALLESELFGYEKGAFTGAVARKPGRVEIADGGTLFLDEIGDISGAMQVKLLRLLQDREYERLGGVETLHADVRFVAATHRDLERMMRAGEFREDLFYRLNVVPVWLPPLRARRDDIPLLARSFCEAFGEGHAKPGITLSEDAIQLLARERWPGNVRQLQNFIERLVVLCRESVIGVDDVRGELAPPVVFATQGSIARAPAKPAPAGGAQPEPTPSVGGPLETQLRETERRAIERALANAKGNRTLAARLLGVSRATLYAKLEEHGFEKRR